MLLGKVLQDLWDKDAKASTNLSPVVHTNIPHNICLAFHKLIKFHVIDFFL